MIFSEADLHRRRGRGADPGCASLGPRCKHRIVAAILRDLQLVRVEQRRISRTCLQAHGRSPSRLRKGRDEMRKSLDSAMTYTLTGQAADNVRTLSEDVRTDGQGPIRPCPVRRPEVTASHV